MEKGTKLKVLDHGHVIYVDHLGSDEDICDAARVSYQRHGSMRLPEENRRLINYLYKNKHTSPFEMGKVVLNIKMPIFVARQYIRHRMQNVNEVSARYTELPEEFYIPEKWRAQDTKNKQGSVSSEDIDHLTPTAALRQHCQKAYDLYQSMIKDGIAREMARMVLPINIYTEMRVCWDLKNLMHFISLREDAHAQAEIRDYGAAIKNIVTHLFPMTMSAYGRFKFRMEEIER